MGRSYECLRPNSLCRRAYLEVLLLNGEQLLEHIPDPHRSWQQAEGEKRKPLSFPLLAASHENLAHEACFVKVQRWNNTYYI